MNAFDEIVDRVTERCAGLGCCKTEPTERRKMKKDYKKTRKTKLRENRKRRRKFPLKTRERPGGTSHEKRKVYRKRNYPNSISQPSRTTPGQIKQSPVGKARKVPKVRNLNVEKPLSVKKVKAAVVRELISVALLISG